MAVKKKYIPIFKFILLIAFLLLVFVHFIIKDRFHGLSTLFYALPLPIIWSFGLIITFAFKNYKTIFYGLFFILIGMAIYFFTHYFGTAQKESSSGNNHHLLFWNVAQSQPLPTDIIIRNIKDYDPEIIALGEAFKVSRRDMEIFKTACPEYEFKSLYGTMLIAVKGSIDDVVYEDDAEVYRLNYIKATINQMSVYIMVVDIFADPLLNKEIPLGIIHEFSKKNPVDVLIGDFNTPYESVFFKPFKTNFNSFHPYSVGMTYTWPLPVPLIEIDQIWLAKSYQPLKLQKFCYKNSDHKLLIAEYK